MRIDIQGMRSGYAEVCQTILKHGENVSPRGQLTKEILDVVVVMHEPADSLPTGTGRKTIPRIAVVESLQLLAGQSYPELTCRVAPNMANYMDNGQFYGAYGVRTRGQITKAIKRLKADKDTRQAVVTIWDPKLDQVDGLHDYPCTVMLQFLIRNDRLILHTTMRSNDVWWGYGNDVYQFTQLQLAVANVLGIEVGSYHHHAVSMHAYERDWDGIETLTVNEDTSRTPFADGIGANSITWEAVAGRANDILHGLFVPGATEEYSMKKLEQYY